MSKTKIAIMDDSQPETEVKNQKSKIKNKKKTIEAKVDVASSMSEAGEVSSESTSIDVHEPNQADGEQSEPAELKKQDQPSDQSISKPTHPSDGSKKAQKPGKSKPRSKKYKELTEDLDRTLTYSLNEAIAMVKKLSYSKFIGTLEAHINTNQSGIRGLVSLPFSTGKKLTILAFGKEAADCGADIIGTDETIDEINKGKINFDLVVTSPDWMPKLAKVARILGPRSLMPNPKNGTITTDLKKAVEGFQAGKTEYKTEAKGFVIHIGLGKLDQPTEELSANVKTLLQTLGKTRVKKVSLAPTQGPSVKVNLTSI